MTTSHWLAIVICLALAGTVRGDNQAEVSATLDNFHRAAAAADSTAYFATLTEQVVFLGTDASERWQGQDFRDFVTSHFDTGQGWTYRPRHRDVVVSPDGVTAWFDELLENDSLGTCRGSGVLVKSSSGWKIAQYNLSIPVPNALASQVAAEIAALPLKMPGSGAADAAAESPARAAMQSAPPSAPPSAQPSAPEESPPDKPDYKCSKKRFKTNTKGGC